MAPSPEYDKEPKAPDKSATNISSEDTKLLHNLINDQHLNSDHKTANSATNSEVENNKHVETLDDDKLRALLNEALTYKCPKDREGKSSLFKELLEEVEQDDQQACEAAARNLTGCRGSRRGARGRRALPHSNSLQDLVAALAAEPAPRRHHARHHHQTAAPSTVAARAIHGGSLPSGVDTSSLLSEESGRCGSGSSTGTGGYLATVRCVNPPPLAERRVSASDANAPHELELLHRRSKPMFPMTYTARATLEIGSGSVSSGRAVTTTTASNQVRTWPLPPAPAPPPRRRPRPPPPPRAAPCLDDQSRLLGAICSKMLDEGGGTVETAACAPRGPSAAPPHHEPPHHARARHAPHDVTFVRNIDMWYDGLAAYDPSRRRMIPSDSVTKRDETAHFGNEDVVSRPWKNFPDKKYHDDLSREGRLAAPYTTVKETFEGTKYSEKTYLTRSDEIVHSVVEYTTRSRKSDISVRKTYRERLVSKTLTVPTPPSLNPRNVRNMSIGKPPSSTPTVGSQTVASETNRDTVEQKHCQIKADEVLTPSPILTSDAMDVSCKDVNKIESEILESMEDQTSKCFQMIDMSPPPAERALAESNTNALNPTSECYDDIELEEIVCHRDTRDTDTGSFTKYLAGQHKLLQALEATADSITLQDEYPLKVLEQNNNVKSSEHDVEPVRMSAHDVSSDSDINTNTNIENDAITRETKSCDVDTPTVSNEALVPADRNDERATGDRYILAELPNNAYIFLTLPKRLLTPLNREYRPSSTEVTDIEDDRSKRKSRDKPVGTSNTRRKDTISKNALRALLFENLLKNDRGDASPAPAPDQEVDSAIPFSCITTPEVVSSCNTTPSCAQPALVLDPKPLQLDSEYAAVASLTGASSLAAPAHRLRLATDNDQPRSVITSSFNGLPLSRPNYGSTATTSSEEYKKSLDENGNSVQTYSSPLSGSSQHKKPRRKKSSKNETVIDCRQLDGYQGDKDVNELLRFIESNAEQRAPKLRAKHKEEPDDKGAKKRSTERRKDKETKVKRASSLDELSRTKLEDLTAAPRPAPAKPERRSWGDAAPSPAPAPPTDTVVAEPATIVAEQADFQTVTKKRKPRRRTEEAPARRTRAPSPRRRESAPPSERSNDSNDDLDSVHSLPEAARAPAAPPAPVPAHHASYADIARTRHNIPDLIESCNYYAEGEGGAEPARRGEPAVPHAAPPDAEGYPALEARVAESRRSAARDKPAGPPPPALRRERKEPPAPDVLADRRPAVILLESGARPRDMDGVTFGFDINEQLLGGGGARRPRCDLLRDAVEPPPPPPPPAPADKRPLRYVPPPPPPDTAHLHQIIDYVGAAWEDVVRCGGGKVRYYSE